MNHAKRLTYSGLFAALIMVSTAYLKFPTTLGYIHLGDGVIFLSSAVLGPYAGLCAGVGSALADLLAGYTLYAPVTFAIKGIMGAAAGYFLLKKRPAFLSKLLLLLLLEGFMVLGYLVFEAVLYGFEAALSSALFNCIQGAAGVLIGLIAIHTVPGTILHQ
ncbi:MAG: ECF transporter S component [Clostridiales bacterium]|nr:ECF transporter S component [Clostridiales bacterium]